jgi:hypothetical protein
LPQSVLGNDPFYTLDVFELKNGSTNFVKDCFLVPAGMKKELTVRHCRELRGKGEEGERSFTPAHRQPAMLSFCIIAGTGKIPGSIAFKFNRQSDSLTDGKPA